MMMAAAAMERARNPRLMRASPLASGGQRVRSRSGWRYSRRAFIINRLSSRNPGAEPVAWRVDAGAPPTLPTDDARSGHLALHARTIRRRVGRERSRDRRDA